MVHNAIKLIECPRDAWQGLKRQIPTELKARYLRALIEAGFKHIDAVSFVSPKAVPQMADSEKVLEQIDLLDDVEIIGIVVNENSKTATKYWNRLKQRLTRQGGTWWLTFPWRSEIRMVIRGMRIECARQ